MSTSLVHIISATSSYDGNTLTTSQHAMCGALLGSYQEAVNAGHPTGNYIGSTVRAARAKGVTCPGCLARMTLDVPGEWVSINDIIAPVTIEASNGNRRVITLIEHHGLGLPTVVFENGDTNTWTRDTRFFVVDGHADKGERFIATAVAAYVKTALWATTAHDEDGDVDENLDTLGYTIDDLTPAALADVEADVEGFVVSCWADVRDLDPEQVGHDLLLTRDGHGAGFWDRGLGERGDRLTAMAKPYGDSNFHVGDDGKIHVG
jgi:hypothetical protein